MIRVLAFGTFDLLHPGHAAFLRFAKQQGGHLTVVVARERTVLRLKGHASEDGEDGRLDQVRALHIADDVRLGDEQDHLKVVRDIRPDVIVLGYDQGHFADTLEADLRGMGLTETRIVRAPSFEPERWKSSKLRTANGHITWRRFLAQCPDGLSEDQLRFLAITLARQARAGDVYLLSGQLGAGKTTFTQAFLRALGAAGEVTSPTYVYELPHHTRLGQAYHLDLYRIEHVERLVSLGIQERLADRDNLLLVEWPEALEPLLSWSLGRRLVRIGIKGADQGVRHVSVEGLDESL